MKLKKYYIDFNLEKINELNNLGLDIKEIHTKKFKKFITELYIKEDEENKSTELSQKDIYTIFTSNYYRKLNNKKIEEYKLFNTIAERVFLGSNQNSKLSRYQLNIDVDYYLKKYNPPIIEYEVDIKKNTKNKIFERFLTIDKKNIQQHLKVLNKKYLDTELTKEEKKEKIHLEIILKLLNKDTSKLKLIYEEKPNGRMYNQFSNLKKTIRKKLLDGYYEYDVSTASFQWLYDVAHQIDKDINTPSIKEYLLNKKEVRYKLADEIGVNYDTIKEIITSIGFGAKDTESYFEYYDNELLEVIKEPLNAIEIILNKNNIPYEGWKNSNQIQDFVSEIKSLKIIVLNYIKDNYYNKTTKTINMNNKKMKFEKQFQGAKALAFMYQHYESHFLKSMVKTYTQQTKNKDIFKLHDAIIVKKEIDIKLLEDSKQNLDFHINWKLEKEIIK